MSKLARALPTDAGVRLGMDGIAIELSLHLIVTQARERQG